MISDDMKAALERPLRDAFDGYVYPPLSCGRKGMPAIVIETIFQGRMMVARTPDGTVARAERTNTGPGTGTYELTLANGRVIGKGYAALPARLHLAWAGRYYLGLLARGIA